VSILFQTTGQVRHGKACDDASCALSRLAQKQMLHLATHRFKSSPKPVCTRLIDYARRPAAHGQQHGVHHLAAGQHDQPEELLHVRDISPPSFAPSLTSLHSPNSRFLVFSRASKGNGGTESARWPAQGQERCLRPEHPICEEVLTVALVTSICTSRSLSLHATY
jgi:hypothetical protein